MKNSFYFPHDYDASSDLKISAMLSDYGASGYGMFWVVIEALHKEEAHKIEMKKYVYAALAKRVGANLQDMEKFVNSCINDYELFVSDGNYFWSERVFRNIGKRNEIREKREKAGKISAENRKKYAKEITLVEQVFNKCSTSVEQNLTSAEQNATKERKEKERKEKKENKEKEKNIGELPLAFGSDNFKKVWSEFLAYRKSKKKPVSYLAAQKIMQKLRQKPEQTAVLMLETSMQNDWTGIFDVKETTKKEPSISLNFQTAHYAADGCLK